MIEAEVNEIDRDKEVTPSVYLSIEHDLKYVPTRLKTTGVENDYIPRQAGFNPVLLTDAP